LSAVATTNVAMMSNIGINPMLPCVHLSLGRTTNMAMV
jgi:hypothetical protein